MDIWSPEKRSAVMSSIRSTETRPELAVQGIVRRALPRFKLQVPPESLTGRPDLFLPSLKLAIFVEGCFWHRCPKHGNIPQSNVDYWAPKLMANVSRDRRVERILRRQGLIAWHVWEHDLRPASLAHTEDRLARSLKNRATEYRTLKRRSAH